MDDNRDRENSRSPARDNGGNGDSNVPTVEGNLFIGNLSFDTTERDLEDAFSKYGRVTKTRVITDRDTGKPRGFGFVTFEDPRDAEDALTGMHGYNLQGREIRVDKTEARSKGSGGGGRGGFDNREKPLCRLYMKGDCKYGSACRFSHEGGGSRSGDRDRDWGRGRDDRGDFGRRRDGSRDRRDSRRDDSRERRDTRRDDRDRRRDDSRERRDSRRDDSRERRDSRRDRDYDDR